MRVSSTVLAAACAITWVAQLSPAWAQSDPDVRQALAAVRVASRNFSSCSRLGECGVYFDSFGVGLTFGDGSIAPFAHVQRLSLSAHDCILRARAYLEHGDRALAVQWVMAARLDDPAVRNWLGEHPEAVLEALHYCCR